MNNAENVARLTDTVSPEEQQAATATAADNASGPVVQKVLDAQTILDGAYSELVNSGKIEAGKQETFNIFQYEHAVIKTTRYLTLPTVLPFIG